MLFKKKTTTVFEVQILCGLLLDKGRESECKNVQQQSQNLPQKPTANDVN